MAVSHATCHVPYVATLVFQSNQPGARPVEIEQRGWFDGANATEFYVIVTDITPSNPAGPVRMAIIPVPPGSAPARSGTGRLQAAGQPKA